MIYISSSCVNARYIKKAIEKLYSYGFTNIELTGGTYHYEGLEDDLLRLKRKYRLNYIFHHYFPPEKENFVLNLASLDCSIHKNTILHLSRVIELSKRYETGVFGFHAGFYTDVTLNEIGVRVKPKTLFNKKYALERFGEGYSQLLKKAAGEVELYIENNVYSHTNYDSFGDDKPFMLIDFVDYKELMELFNFKLLLDIGHLKISCQSLHIPFTTEIEKMARVSDYYHLSDNDGVEDRHTPVYNKTDTWGLVNRFIKDPKIVTIETKAPAEDLKRSYQSITKNYYA